MANGQPKKAGDAADNSYLDGIPHEREGERPDFSKIPLKRRALPKDIQDNLDNDEKYWEVISEGRAGETTDSNLRYAAYATRVRTILLSAQRYIAYTSVSWLYLAGDVSHEGYKAYLANQRVRHPEKFPAEQGTESQKPGSNPSQETSIRPGMTDNVAQTSTPGKVPAIEDYRAVMAQRAVFQSIASMGLPAFTIHSIVRYSGQAMKNVKNVKLRTWGPIGLGLGAVPFLPFLFDKPVEHAVETVFHKGFELIGGPEAVAHTPIHGKAELRREANEVAAIKEKEL